MGQVVEDEEPGEFGWIARNCPRMPAGQFSNDTLGNRADVVDVQLKLGKTRDEAMGDRHARQSPRLCRKIVRV
jgi:hypothetical protein